MSEEKKEEKKEVKVPEKFKKIVEEVEKMSVLDLSELVKVLEEKFGVSASAPAMMMAIPQGDQGAEDGAGSQEKSSYNVELITTGASKISIIKIVKEITGLGLKEAKDLVDGAPKVIKENVAKKDAEEMKKKLEDAGAKVELK